MLDLAAMFAVYSLLWVVLPLPVYKGTLLSLTFASFGTFLPMIIRPPIGFLLAPVPFPMFLYVIQLVAVECSLHLFVIDLMGSTLICGWSSPEVIGTNYSDIYTCTIGEGLMGFAHVVALSLHLLTYRRIRLRALQVHNQCSDWWATVKPHMTFDKAQVAALENKVLGLYKHPWIPLAPTLHLVSPRGGEVKIEEVAANEAVAALSGKDKFFVFRQAKSHAQRTQSNARRPVLLFIHGGGWMGGHPVYHPAAGLCFTLALLLDWVVVSIDYRRVPKQRLPDVVDDATEACRWVQQHIVRYGGDGNNVFVGGESAGGHLAALLAIKFSCPDKDARENPIRGAFLHYPITDVGDVGLSRFVLRTWGPLLSNCDNVSC